MTNKELEARIKELERLAKKHDDDIAQLTENVDVLIEEKHKNQPHHKFQVGDRVQFKSWEEMEKEHIDQYYMNAYRLEMLAGTYATIDRIKEGTKPYVTLKDFSINKDIEFFEFLLYNPDMLKPATDEPKYKFKVGDKVKEINPNDKYFNKIGEIQYNFANFSPNIYSNVYFVEFDKKDIGSIQLEQDLEPYTEPRWTFTDDEKVILRNLESKFEWIARDRDGNLCGFCHKPIKSDYEWEDDSCLAFLSGFTHLFQSIKWTDEEPCEFRKYL